MAIIQYLRLKGYTGGKTKTMGVYDPRIRARRFDPYTFRGFPDLTVFTPELVFIEVKAPKGRMSEYQKNFQELCEKAGIKYILARSLDDVIEVIY